MFYINGFPVSDRKYSLQFGSISALKIYIYLHIYRLTDLYESAVYVSIHELMQALNSKQTWV